MAKAAFRTEAEMVELFCQQFPKYSEKRTWTAYHETAGWDLLLVADDNGDQIGIEAKLSLNAKVLAQSLPGRWFDRDGPDYRAVMVPQGSCQVHMQELALALGLTVLEIAPPGSSWGHSRFLPTGATGYPDMDWQAWLPERRCKLPDYVPDVIGGKAAPVKLTAWKISAMKLLIILERRGYVTRADMRLLGLSPSRWTAWDGYLTADKDLGGYVRSKYTPDLQKQHPAIWDQIAADYDKWAPKTVA